MQMSKHVYNMNLSFFYTPDLNEIRAYVQQYLLKNSKSPLSLIESTGRRGYYRLNTRNNIEHFVDARDWRQRRHTYQPRESRGDN